MFEVTSMRRPVRYGHMPAGVGPILARFGRSMAELTAFGELAQLICMAGCFPLAGSLGLIKRRPTLAQFRPDPAEVRPS